MALSSNHLFNISNSTNSSTFSAGFKSISAGQTQTNSPRDIAPLIAILIQLAILSIALFIVIVVLIKRNISCLKERNSIRACYESHIDNCAPTWLSRETNNRLAAIAQYHAEGRFLPARFMNNSYRNIWREFKAQRKRQATATPKSPDLPRDKLKPPPDPRVANGIQYPFIFRLKAIDKFVNEFACKVRKKRGEASESHTEFQNKHYRSFNEVYDSLLELERSKRNDANLSPLVDRMIQQIERARFDPRDFGEREYSEFERVLKELVSLLKFAGTYQDLFYSDQLLRGYKDAPIPRIKEDTVFDPFDWENLNAQFPTLTSRIRSAISERFRHFFHRLIPAQRSDYAPLDGERQQERPLLGGDGDGDYAEADVPDESVGEGDMDVANADADRAGGPSRSFAGGGLQLPSLSRARVSAASDAPDPHDTRKPKVSAGTDGPGALSERETVALTPSRVKYVRSHLADSDPDVSATGAPLSHFTHDEH